MPVSPDSLIGDRYKLLDCLGAGAMGEVWKAQDTNFSRLVVVAVKLLKEDDTLADDARQRGNFERKIRREAADSPLTINVLVAELDEAFNIGVNRPALKTAVESRFGEQPITPEAALAFFDDLSADSTYNENARHRRRLRDMFAAEANSVAVLQHPNIVRVTDYGEQQNGVPFLVMDFINGRTLQQVIQRREDMPLTRRLRLMEDLCEGLGYAHAKDLIHRDIKPANLIIDSDTQRLKILDFGVARAAQISAQRTLSRGAPIGTYCYMSPEQTRAVRTLDNRSDIFAVGLVCYELLSFQRAFPIKVDVNDLIARIQRDPPQPLRDLVSNLDPALERIVYRAIEKTPAKRYQDLSEMHRDLEIVRGRLEEEEKRLTETEGGRTRLVKRKTTAQQVTDLLDRAQSAFDTEDDHAVIEFCQQVVTLIPQQPDAVELKERALARINLHAAEAAVAEGRGLLDAGDVTAADSVLRRPGLDVQLPVVRDFVRELESARQRRRVDQLVGEARTAFAAANYDETIRLVRTIFNLDAGNRAAQDLLTQAEAALEAERQAAIARRQEQIANTIREADAEAAQERWDAALRLLSTIAAEAGVRERIDRVEQQRAAAAARRAALDDALARTRHLLDREDFRAASLALREATQIDAGHPDIAVLDARLTPLLLVIEELESAIAAFDGGDTSTAEAQFAHARATLEALPQRPASLRRLVASAERARAAQQQRALTTDASDALQAGRLDEALAAARAAVAIEGASDAARAMLAQVEAAITTRGEREVDAAIAAANAHAAEQRFDEALDAIAGVVEHPRGRTRQRELVRAQQQHRDLKKRVAAMVEVAQGQAAAGDFAKAAATIADVLTLDARDPGALELKQSVASVSEALARIDEAERLFASDDIVPLDRAREALAKGASALAPFAATYPTLQSRISAATSAQEAAYARRRGLEQTLLDAVSQFESSPSAELRQRVKQILGQLFGNRTEPVDGAESEGVGRLAAADQAIQVRDRARKLLDKGAFEQALASIHDAAARRETTVDHPILAREIEAIEAAIRQQAVEREREKEARERLVGQLTSNTEQRLGGFAADPAAVDAGAFDAVAGDIKKLRDLGAASDLIARLETELRGTRTARKEIVRARELVGDQRLEDALRHLEKFQSRHSSFAAEMARVQALIGERDEALARAAEERARAAEARAREEAAERARAAEELERERQALEQRVTAAIAAADTRVVAGELRQAIEDLTAFRPQHDRITERLRDLEHELKRLEDAKRAEEDRLRAEQRERERQALEERATAAIVAAEAQFAGGQRQQAIEQLAAFAPEHPRVERAVFELGAELARLEEEQRAEEERLRAEQRERERQALEQRVTTTIADAEAVFAAGDQELAIEDLAAFTPRHPRIDRALAVLRAQLARLEEAKREEEERARAAERERERQELEQRAATAITAAEALFAAGEPERAIEELAAFQPPHPQVDRALADFRVQLARLEEARRAEEERALAEQRERERQALEQRVTAAIGAAETLFADGERERAIEELAAFEPQHPRVDEALTDLRTRRARLEDARRAEEERVRIEAERAERVNNALESASRNEYAAAFESIAAAVRLAPSHAETLQARESIVMQLRAAVQQAPADKQLRSLLYRYDPVAKRRRLVTVASRAAAVLVLAAGVGVAYQFLTTEEQGADRPFLQQGPGRTDSVRLPPAPVPPVTLPPLPPGKMASLTVDLRPWALVSIKAKEANVTVPPNPLETPFTVNLPAGEYLLVAENDGLTKSLEFSVTLREGEPFVVSRLMPDFNVERIVDTLLGTAK